MANNLLIYLIHQKTVLVIFLRISNEIQIYKIINPSGTGRCAGDLRMYEELGRGADRQP